MTSIYDHVKIGIDNANGARSVYEILQPVLNMSNILSPVPNVTSILQPLSMTSVLPIYVFYFATHFKCCISCFQLFITCNKLLATSITYYFYCRFFFSQLGNIRSSCLHVNEPSHLVPIFLHKQQIGNFFSGF